MNFNEWLIINEAINEARGAFGKDTSRMSFARQSSFNTPNSKVPIPRPKIADINDGRSLAQKQQIDYGQGIEKQIFNNLVKCGLKLRSASEKEDMYDKVDAWWKTPQGEFGVQIKYKEAGNDIIFEVMKDYYKGIPGKDMVGKASFYAVLNTSNVIVMISLAEAKALIQKARELAQTEGFDERGNFSWGNVSLKLRPDKFTQQIKMMAYIPVHALKQVITPCTAKVNY